MTRTIIDYWQKVYADFDNRRFLRLLLLALLLRVILMPFSGHIDLLSEARRVFYWVQNDIWFDNFARNTTQLVEVIFFRLTAFLLPSKFELLFYADMANPTSSVHNAFEFFSHFDVFRTIFVFKLPYLVCDLLIGWLLFKWYGNKDNALASVKLWWFNPITLYSVYIFGRFESIPVFFFTAALYLIKKNRIVWAALMLGLALNARELMNLYFPIFLAALLVARVGEFELNKRWLAAVVVLMFAAVALQLPPMILPISKATGQAAASVMQEGRVKHLFAFHIHGIRIFVLIYSLVLIWCLTDRRQVYRKMLLGGAMAMFAFFAFSSHTAHFTAWMIIFPAVYYGRERQLLWPFIVFCLAWFGYWAFVTDLGVFTVWLWAPFSLQLTGVPNVPKLFLHLNRNMPLFSIGMMVFLFKTVYVAALAYMAYLVIRSERAAVPESDLNAAVDD